MYEENELFDDAKQCLKRYLESTERTDQQGKAWERLWRLCARTNDWLGAIDALAQSAEIRSVGISYISNVANDLNLILRRQSHVIDSAYRRNAVRRVAELMEKRTAEMNATDCSRLAWLFVHLSEIESARKITQLGLRLDPNNEHCLGLAAKLF